MRRKKNILIGAMTLALSLGAWAQAANASIPLGNPNAVKGGTFKRNLGAAPTTLNPLSSSDLYASYVQAYVVEQLLERNADTYDWDPMLAEKWSVSKDGLSFEFTLRKGLKWSDGKPVTAEDIKFTFDAIMDPKNRWKTAHSRPYYENIKGVEILAPNKVKFLTKKKYFRNFAQVAQMDILPKHIYSDLSKDNKRKLNKTIVGSGPYTIYKYKKGKSLILKKNKNWWGNASALKKGEHNYDKVLLRFIADGTVAITRLEKGDLDFLGLSTEEYMKKAKGGKWGKEVLKVKYSNKSPKSYGFIGWNLKNELFKSKKLRRALNHLINRDLMIKKFRFGMALPATGPLYRQSIYADPNVKPIGFDPKKALAMLKEDGWQPGSDNILFKTINGKKKRLSFTIIEPNKEFVKYLTIFKQDAKKAGVEVKIKFVEWTSFIKLLDERKFEACRLGWGGGSVDWDPKQIWHSSSIANKGSNFVGYSNPEVDKLIDQARLTMDKEKRIPLLRKVFKLIANDAPYAFFFNDEFGFYGHGKKVKRVKDTYDYGVGHTYWWLEK